MSDSKIRGYRVSEEIFSTLRALDTTLRGLEGINSDLCLFQSETGIPVRSHVFEGIGSLREAESCFLAAQRSMEVAGHLRVIDEIASQDVEFEEARAREFVQEQMWNGYSTFLLGRGSVTMVISDSPYKGLTKDRFGRITETNQQKVGEVIVAELVAKGYTKSSYGQWNDTYNHIRVEA